MYVFMLIDRRTRELYWNSEAPCVWKARQDAHDVADRLNELGRSQGWTVVPMHLAPAAFPE